MTSYIIGEFQKYKFEIRAYRFTGNSLKDIDLESSEVALLYLLNDENIQLANLPEEDTYSLRKWNLICVRNRIIPKVMKISNII